MLAVFGVIRAYAFAPLKRHSTTIVPSSLLSLASFSNSDDVIIEEEVVTKTTDTSSNQENNIQDRRVQLRKELKQYRTDQSVPLGKPAYTVFTNASLDGICACLPTSNDELLDVKGIGKKKVEMFGEDILSMVNQHVGKGLARLTLLPDESQGKQVVPRPDPIAIESLTTEQRQAADIALDTENPNSVFISGAAGTGKSFVLKFIIQTLQERGTKKIGVCAPTGVAAINVGGSTLHSFFGIGLGNGKLNGLIRKVRKNKEAMKRIEEIEVLLIDEVSMLSSDLMETLDNVVRDVRMDGKRRNEPFGGMQLICVGDFFQLPPITQQRSDRDGDRDEMRPFCFDSHVWSELGLVDNTFELMNVQRQESGSPFEKFLNMVRLGTVGSEILHDFNKKCLISNDHPLPVDGIVPTRLYTHNRDVDAVNEARLGELEGERITCKAIDEWTQKMPTGTKASIKKNMVISVATESPDDVNLKVGAQVMLTRNRDTDRGDRGLVNGSRGVVERFVLDLNGDQIPVVRFDNGRREKIGKVETMRYNPDGGPGCLRRKQIPLKLGWALTVHKSQGSTLTRAILDISSTFEPGQAYVSLSRVKSIDGLWLERPVRRNNIMVSRRVLNYYKGLS